MTSNAANYQLKMSPKKERNRCNPKITNGDEIFSEAIEASKYKMIPPASQNKRPSELG